MSPVEVFGLVVGIVAKFLMPGRDPGGFIITPVVGIVGALLGGYLGRAIGWYREGDAVGFVMAVSDHPARAVPGPSR